MWAPIDAQRGETVPRDARHAPRVGPSPSHRTSIVLAECGGFATDNVHRIGVVMTPSPSPGSLGYRTAQMRANQRDTETLPSYPVSR